MAVWRKNIKAVKMTEEAKKAEDVAAVLAGKVKCPGCGGSGESWRWENSGGELEREFEECAICGGKRWMTVDERESWIDAYNEEDYS